jgi:hypothetical protein
MKASTWRYLAMVAIGATALGGCSSAKRPSVHSVSVAVTTIDGKPPSQEQAAQILSALSPEIERAGFRLARSSHEADFVVSVKYTAEADGKGGRVSITGMEPSSKFGAAQGTGESEELKEIRRRLHEMDAWGLRQMTRIDP